MAGIIEIALTGPAREADHGRCKAPRIVSDKPAARRDLNE